MRDRMKSFQCEDAVRVMSFDNVAQFFGTQTFSLFWET